MDDLVGGVLDSRAFVARLRALRQSRGMSAQQLADKTGCMSRSALANLENGRRGSISLDEARVLCDALGVDLRVALSDAPMPVATKVYVV